MPIRSDRGGVAGIVYDSTNRPLAEAVVMIVDGPTHPDIAALTGDDGSYDYNELLPGRYQIAANALDHGSQTQTVEVAAGTVTKVDFLLD
ncbi:MAG: carboxypeptidase-like regulatory domain-containing protein [Chloroflexota bacterium]|jgi:protocatechuate 3,4-dioxygenase beta subunit